MAADQPRSLSVIRNRGGVTLPKLKAAPRGRWETGVTGGPDHLPPAASATHPGRARARYSHRPAPVGMAVSGGHVPVRRAAE